jgi:hypothetical protein
MVLSEEPSLKELLPLLSEELLSLPHKLSAPGSEPRARTSHSNLQLVLRDQDRIPQRHRAMRCGHQRKDDHRSRRKKGCWATRTETVHEDGNLQHPQSKLKTK